jgi:hypothetical protein
MTTGTMPQEYPLIQEETENNEEQELFERASPREWFDLVKGLDECPC